MAKKKTILVIGLFVVAICFAIIGYAFSEVSDANEPISVSNGYVDENGQLQLSYTGNGVIGGDEDVQESTAATGTIFYILAAVAAVGGFITLFYRKKDT